MNASKATDADRLGRVQSLVRAFRILDKLSTANAMPLSELAGLVDLPKSTVHRLLTTMEALEYVQFDRDNNRWSVGVSAFRVGSAFAQTSDFEKVGRGIIRSLVLEVNHSASLCVPRSIGIFYLHQVQARGGWPTAARQGASLPMYSTAAGKCVMACWTEKEFGAYFDTRELVQRTRRTIGNRDALRRELAAILERGYAIDDEEQADGTRCIAAVVTDRIGQPRGALSVSDSISRLRRKRFDDIGTMVAGAARRMSQQATFCA